MVLEGWGYSFKTTAFLGGKFSSGKKHEEGGGGGVKFYDTATAV